MNRKIVFTTGSLRRGGAERVISIIANELVKRGWDVYIITVLFSQIGYRIDNRIKIIDISNESKKQILDTPRLIREIKRNVKEIKPHAVVSFMLTINIVTWLATRNLDVIFIPSERNDPSQGRGKIKHWLSCQAYANSHKTVFQTERARSYYSKKIQENGVIIPNPVQVDQKRSKQLKRKIVSVGRLEPQKNRKLLIDAFSDFHKKYPEYTLDIYGEGSQEAELRQMISVLNLEHNVTLHGNVDNVHEQIADAEVFVLSSDYEGLSNALIEAMIMGIPCISTDCAGASDVIENGIDGFIVPIRNKKEMLEAIEKLVADELLRTMFSQNAVKHSKIYAVDNVVNQWEKLISE